MPEFEALVITYHATVLRIAQRRLGGIEDARDAAQEVFLKLLRSGPDVPRDIGAWLYRVTVNICHDHYRRRKPLAELSPNRPDTAPDPEYILRRRQTQMLVTEALNRLTEREREAVILRHIEGLSTGEAAASLKLKPATVRSRTHTARIKLAKELRHVRPRESPVSASTIITNIACQPSFAARDFFS